MQGRMTKRAAVAAGVFLAALAAAGPAHAAPQLMITEAMPDPAGTDADREWLEIYNPGTTTVDLTGYAVGDGLDSTNQSGGEGLGVFPDGTKMAPGQVYIIAIRAGGFTSLMSSTFPNVKADFEFTNSQGTSTTVADDPNVPNLTQKANWGNPAGSLGMANGGDDVGIVDPNGNIVDEVTYGGAGTMVSNWVDVASATIQRIGLGSTSADWEYVTGLANSTPGTVNITATPEPASLGLLAMGGVVLFRRRRRG